MVHSFEICLITWFPSSYWIDTHSFAGLHYETIGRDSTLIAAGSGKVGAVLQQLSRVSPVAVLNLDLAKQINYNYSCYQLLHLELAGKSI